MPDFASLRKTMVDTQLRTNKIIDERILAAMADVPREDFVPADRRDLAYIDEDITIGAGRYLLEPMVFARLVQMAGIRPGDVVLDIASGTGYSSAILGRLARAVVAVESDTGLAEIAAAALSAAGQDNVVLEEGPIQRGWAPQAPYDVILFNGAIDYVPEAIVEQLADGGRLCAVMRRGSGQGTAELTIKSRGIVSGRAVFDANTPKLREFELEKGFVF
tara:strand:- start:138 stop:794 length:657 start_codon:yes stop_codon:yes gene_type:complete